MTSGMEHEIELRLKWRHTWPDREDDFCAEAPTFDGSVGRIYRHDSGPSKGQWFWAFQAHGYDISRTGDLSGYEPSARQAAKRVEDAWFFAIRGSSHDVAVPAPAPRNAYAEAKGRV